MPRSSRSASGSDPSDRDAHLGLCRKVAAGDRAAAEELARVIMPTVRHAALRLTRTTTDAQDAAQVATLEVLRSAKRFQARGTLKGWAGRIAIRSVLRWQGRHGTAASVEHDPDTEPAPQGPPPGFEMLPRPLEHYLNALSEPQRNALVLRHSFGYTLPEIATLTDAPLPTVRSRVSAAMERVRKAIRRDVRLGGRGVAS